MNWYMDALKKYAEFSGRARRMEFWMFTLINVLVVIALSIVGNVVGRAASLLLGLYCLAILIPAIAVTFRRLHDTGRSGWWILIALVPFIGSIVLLIFEVLPGATGENQYGPDPKMAA